MKYILVLLVVVFAIGLWQHNRRPSVRDAAPPRPPKHPLPTPPQDMVVCAHCGVHLPVGDASNGSRVGLYYCCDAHRLAGEAGKSTP